MSRPDQLALVTLVYGMGSAIALADGHSVDPTATGVGLLALPLVSASVHHASEYADYFADYLAVRTPFSGGSGALQRTGRSVVHAQGVAVPHRGGGGPHGGRTDRGVAVGGPVAPTRRRRFILLSPSSAAMSRLKRVLSRVRYAAIGAAVGGGLGAVLSRSAASTGAGVGALLGATIGEKRVEVKSLVRDVKREKSEE